MWVKNYIIYIYENAFDILLNKFNQKVFKEDLVNDIRYSWTPCINFKMLYLIIPVGIEGSDHRKNKNAGCIFFSAVATMNRQSKFFIL